jgi:hypothetical protein
MPTALQPTGDSGSLSSAEISWFGVAAPEIAAWWPHAEPYVARALAEGRGEMEPCDVRRFLELRAMQLWLLWDGAARGALVTEIANHPRKRSCILRLFAADRGLRAAWRALIPLAEEWAREQGCDAVEVFGRPGWARLLDYELKQVVLSKELQK